MKRKWIVSKKDHQTRLSHFLAKHSEEKSSQKKWKRVIEDGLVQINGKVERFRSSFVSSGDVIIASVPNKSSLPSLLYEDSYLSIWNKPAGLRSEEVSSSEILLHRLDKPTSGALLFAKKGSYVEPFTNLFRTRQIQKKYIAIVHGKMMRSKGSICSRISKKKEGVFVSSTKGSYAKTNYRLENTSTEKSLVHLTPITGRTHQLRLHMIDLGHPIVGDHHYVRCFSPVKRLYLHAKTLVFTHPFTKSFLEISAPLSKDFIETIEKTFVSS